MAFLSLHVVVVCCHFSSLSSTFGFKSCSILLVAFGIFYIQKICGSKVLVKTMSYKNIPIGWIFFSPQTNFTAVVFPNKIRTWFACISLFIISLHDYFTSRWCTAGQLYRKWTECRIFSCWERVTRVSRLFTRDHLAIMEGIIDNNCIPK